MPVVSFPYGRDSLSYFIPDDRFAGELVSGLHHYKAEKSPWDLVKDALLNPAGSPPLCDLAAGKRKITIIASDHTRPVPGRVIIPQMLEEIRKGNNDCEITILVATGCHRETTREELINKFGADLPEREKIVIHNCDSSEMVNLGKLPSGGDLVLNRIAVEADLLLSEGFIEPHFFAGFSGGPKSVLPGVAGRRTVVYNHNAEFIAHPKARTGVIEGNPIRRDMLFAAEKANLAFICNVVLNSAKEAVFAAAGACEAAHKAGREFLLGKCMVTPVLSDIVIAANGGYPLDQNIYQAVKGMTAAESAVKKGGVIIMIARSDDGHGAPEFYKTFREEKDPGRLSGIFMKTPKELTCVDQWQSQIFARILKHAKIIYISDAPDEMIRDLHMTPAHSIEEAVRTAEKLLGNPKAAITAIPDGVSVIVK